MSFLQSLKKHLGRAVSAVAIVASLGGMANGAESGNVLPGTHPVEAGVLPVQIETPQTDAVQPDRIDRDYIKGYFSDSAKMLSAPLRWDASDWLRTGLVIGATSGIYFADADIRDFAQKNRSSTGKDVARLGNALGNPLLALPSLGLFYLHGHFNEDPKARRTSLLATESLVISGAVALTIKQATGRPRPSTGATPGSWSGPGFKSADPAFPSIHTQTAFSIASVVAEEYGANPYIPPIAYSLAALVGLSRIHDNKHWASDVFFGAAIGYGVGKAVVSYHRKRSDASLEILPAAGEHGLGLEVKYRF